MFVGLAGGAVLELDGATGQTLREVDRQPGRICAIALSPCGDRLASGDAYGNVAVRQLSTGRRLWSQRWSVAPHCRFGWEGRAVIIASGSEVVLVCSLSGKPLASISDLEHVQGLAVAAGEIYACDGGHVTIWNPGRGQATRRFSPTADWTRIRLMRK